MHKKKVRGRFYYYTTVRNGSITRSIYLGKSFSEAKEKEQRLSSKTRISGFNWRALSILGILLLIFGTGVYYLNPTNLPTSISSVIVPNFLTTSLATIESDTYSLSGYEIQVAGLCDQGDEDDFCNISTPKTFSTNLDLNFSTLNIQSGGSIELSSSANLTLNASILVLEPGSNITAQVVNITADTNITIELGSIINLTGTGYAGGVTNGTGSGQGGYDTLGWGGGAGHGSVGGNGGTADTVGGPSYGNMTQPEDLGSGGGGGGSSGKLGGSGGGYLYIECSDTLNVTGLISSDGSGVTTTQTISGGGGSGGSIWINLTTLEGDGSITADGGNAGFSNGGAGSGGRIAIYYTTNNFIGTTSTYGGSVTGKNKGGPGTIYKKQISQNYGDLIIDNNGISASSIIILTINLSLDDLTMNNSGDFEITEDLTVDTLTSNIENANLTLDNTTTFDSGNLTLYNSGRIIVANNNTIFNGSNLTIFSGTAILDITNGIITIPTFDNITIPLGTNLTHTANSSGDYYGIILNATNITIEGNIDTIGKGYSGGTAGNGTGPGQGGYDALGYGGGAGHGGIGGNGSTSDTNGGPAYGSLTWPINTGSGGGGTGNTGIAGGGGGLIRLTASDTITVNGIITVDGDNATTGRSGGGGSGGSIWIDTPNLEGSGSITANGGNNGSINGGGGAGGRIAIYYTNTSFNGITSFSGGTGFNMGEEGASFLCDTLTGITCSGLESASINMTYSNVQHLVSYSGAVSNTTVNMTVHAEWTVDSLNWNESSTALTTATHNLTGLNASTKYEVYSNAVLNISLVTDSSGNLPLFDISLGPEQGIELQSSPVPVVNLEFPLDNETNLTTNTIDFTYNVSDYDLLDNCSLIINEAINITNTSAVEKDTAGQNFTIYLFNGEYNWSINCTDEFNNIGASETRNISINADITSPIISLDNPVDFYNETVLGSFVFNYTANDTSSIDTCELYGNWSGGWHLNETFVSPASGETNGSTNISLEDGQYVWSVYCNDSLNNYNNTVENRTLTVDLTGPVVGLDNPVDYYNETATGSVVFNFTSNDSLSILDTCELWGNWTTGGWHLNESYYTNLASGEPYNSSNITIEDGRYVWSVYCNDSWNNWNTTIGNFSLTIDLTAPVLAITLPLNNTADTDGLVYFNYSVTDSLAGLDSCWLTIDGLVNVTNTTTEIPENFTVTLTQGGYVWNISCNDTLNNVANSDTYDLSIILATEFSGDTTDLSNVNISNITNLAIEVPSDGKINFTNDISLNSSSDLDTYVNISFNRVEVNSTALSELNKAATLYLYNLTFTDPKILKDDADCTSSICTELSYTGGTLAFSVTGFSIYAAAETSTTTPTTTTTPSSTGGSYSGGQPSPTAFSSVTSVDVSTGDLVALSTAQGASFTVKNAEHFVDVKEIGEGFVRLWIYSEPVEVLLKVGKRVNVDIDNDTLADVSIELRSLSNGYAFLYFKEIKSAEEVKLPKGQKVIIEESEQEPLEIPKLELLPKIGAKTFLTMVIKSFESWVKNLVQKITANKYWLTLSLLVILLLFVTSFKHYLRRPFLKKKDLPVKKRKIWPYLLALIILILIIIYLIFRMKGYDTVIFEKLITIKDFN